MAALPVEFLYGVYLGLLTGIIPAFVSGSLGFAFKYLTGVTLPGLGVVVLAVAIAGINGGLMGLLDPAVASSPRILVAIVVVMMLSLYAHSQGDKLGASLPRRVSFRRLRARTLSADALDRFGGVTVTVTGSVADLEGYPPIPDGLRTDLERGSWTFPGDLPLSEVERRLEHRLRTEFDLVDVTATVDGRGRATLAAAPPTGRLSRTLSKRKRAVSISALLPTGLTRGDRVVATTPSASVTGEVVSARSTDGTSLAPGPRGHERGSGGGGDVLPDGGTANGDTPPAATSAPRTEGGEGRVTLAVSRDDATALLEADRARVWVLSRGRHREFELVSLLRRAGKRFRRLTVSQDSDLVGRTLADAAVRERFDVGVMALRNRGRPDTAGVSTRTAGDVDRAWVFAPTEGVVLDAGDEVFVVADRSALDAFAEVVQ